MLKMQNTRKNIPLPHSFTEARLNLSGLEHASYCINPDKTKNVTFTLFTSPKLAAIDTLPPIAPTRFNVFLF
jgi:hypothetical protein